MAGRAGGRPARGRVMRRRQDRHGCRLKKILGYVWTINRPTHPPERPRGDTASLSRVYARPWPPRVPTIPPL
eukprot:6524497-Prymnesium_polylepis.1